MIITTTEQLNQLCARLAAEPFVALDTEFIRERTYYPELCLIQIAGPNEAVCVDPLASKLKLDALFDLLQNPRVVKVFHAARQDVEIFYHLTRQIPMPLFDTQTAAMVCGYGENVGYQKLVQDLLGITLDKSMRVTDWSRRPLTEEQVQYALHDVTHLREIYRLLSSRLAESPRQAWLADEIAIQNNPETYETNNDEVWRRIKIPFKKPLQTHVFARLCAWREKTAKIKNVPRKYIIKDEALVELAALCPKTSTDMAQIRTMSHGFERSLMGQEILHVIEQACAEPADVYPKQWEQPKSLTATQRVMADLLNLLLRLVSAEAQVAAKLIASAEDLNRLACGKNDVPCMTGWRRELFGEKVLLLKQGRLCFVYNPRTHRPEMKEL